MSEQCIYDDERDLYMLEYPFKAEETGGTLAYPFGFEPTFHKYRLDWPKLKKNGSNIFVGSMADVFGEWVPDEWIENIFESCQRIVQHNYLFLTKNPSRYQDLATKGILPKGENLWYGFSLTNNDGAAGWQNPDYHTFVSIEPLLEDLEYFEGPHPKIADWVIIGAETGNRKGKVKPEFEWVKKIVVQCDYLNIPVFMKDSMVEIVGEKNMRRDFPEQLKVQRKSKKLKIIQETYCSKCNDVNDKKDMIAILSRSKRGEGPKHTAYLCEECFKKQCKEWNVEVPELEVFKDGKEKM